MSNISKQLLVASNGNYAVKAAGKNVYTGSANKKNLFNVKTGEIVIFNPKTGLTYDDTTIAGATHLDIAVGVGKKGQLADTIRTVNRNTLKFSSMGCQNYCWYDNLVTPSCSQPKVLDIYFCSAKCGETVSITLEVDTPLLRSYMPNDERQKYTFSATPDCGCETCDGEVNMDDVVCQLVDKINGTFRRARFDQFFGGNEKGDLIQPFKAAKLFTGATTFKEYCLSPESTACQNCVEIDAITGATVKGVAVDFVGTTISAEKTAMNQIDSVVEQLHEALQVVGGSAYIERGEGACCPIKLHVNTCDTTFALKGEAGAVIAPCSEGNPFQAVPNASQGCVNCDPAATTTTTYSHGLRVFLDPIDLNIDDLHGYPPDTFYKDLHQNVRLAGQKGFGCCPAVEYVVQEQVLSEGLGYVFVSREIGQHNGGLGRQYLYDTPRTTLHGLPEKGTAYTSTTIDAATSYNVYNMRLKRTGDDNQVSGAPVRTYTEDYALLIPQSDTTTKTSWDLVLTALRAKF
jgi:hypothetical protein